MSIQIDGTSHLNSTGGGGNIVVTGHNNVVFDGVFGTGSTDLARLELNAVHGNLTIPKSSGLIESDGLIALKGAVVDVQGVFRSTNTTTDTTDFEISIDASDRAIINGDLQLTGSLRINANSVVEVFNTTIAITQPGQRVVFSGGDVRFGKVSADGTTQLGALVTAVGRIEFHATGLVDIGSGSVIATSGNNSIIDLGAGSLRIAGSLLAGATINHGVTTYTGVGADIIVNGREQVAIGGQGIIGGVSQIVGGTLAATGDITVNVHGGVSDVSFTLSPLSTLRTESVAGEPSGTSHNVTINTDQDIQIYSAIVALHSGANVTLISGELIEVDGLLKANNRLTVVGGSDETGVGLSLRVFEFTSDNSGHPVRVHGGTLATNPGGTISIGANQKVVLSGVVGETRNVSGATVADTDEIFVTKAGNVFVMTAINAADRIQFLATNITLAPDSVVRTHATGGRIDLRATNSLIVSSNPDGTHPASIQADSWIHLLGRFVSLDSQTTATGSTGDVFINAVDSVTLFGAVHAGDRLSVNAGVGANWTTARLIGTVTVADLSGGDISINGGTLTSGGAASIVAGHDVTVVGATTVGSAQVPVRRPVITLTPQTIEVITGTRQVAIGSMLVPEVTFVTTTTTEQVGTESVRVGLAFNTADVTLSQLGYYNPNALTAAEQVREYFIEGIDYRKPVVLTNAGFETPLIAAGGYQYAPAASPWTFGNGGGGIASNSSAFNNGTAPSGSQVGFIQGFGSISRTVNVSTAGASLIQFATKGRWAGNRNTINVLVDGVVVKTITPASDDFYSTEATGWINLTAGSHTITFQGTINADVTSFIDSISMIQDNIDWSKAYDPLTDNTITLATSTRPDYGIFFGDLSDLQQDSVLIALGYRRFYSTAFANLETHNTINGIPSTQTWQPSWYGPAVSADVVASYQASYNAGNTAGSGDDGIQRGSVSYAAGISGTGFSFNGTSGTAVLVPNDSALRLNSGTIDAWIKTTDAGSDYHGIVVKQGEYGLYVKGGKLIAYDDAVGDRSTNINVADGQWHHVAMSFRNGVANGTVVYLDGVAVLTTTTSTSQTGYGLAIGSGDSNAGIYQNFNGTIDEVRVWDRILSASEIAAARTPLATEVTMVPIDGWRDKYVLMPTGATSDVLRMVSQGEPTTTEADAGNTWLDTDVKLHQIGWYNSTTGEKRQDSRAGSAWAGFTQGVANPGAGWAALYSLEYLNGVRSAELADGRTFSYSDASISLAGQPTWSFDPSGLSPQYMNGQWVMAPNGAGLDINAASAANRKTADLTQNYTIPVNAARTDYWASVPLGWHQEYLGTYQDPISYTFTATLTWSGASFFTDYDLYVIDGGTGQEISYFNPNGTNLRLSGDASGSSGTETISGTGIGHDANFNVRWGLNGGFLASYVNIVVSITNTADDVANAGR